MSISMRALWVVATVALVCGLYSVRELVRVERINHEMIVTDSVAVPARVERGGGATAGMGPSLDGKNMQLWLARFDSLAATRLTLKNDAAQMLEFSDKYGRPRLQISIDATGAAEIRFLDADGKTHFVKPAD
jgi:hypothetical protein